MLAFESLMLMPFFFSSKKIVVKGKKKMPNEIVCY